MCCIAVYLCDATQMLFGIVIAVKAYSHSEHTLLLKENERMRKKTKE